eukprot:TRINITY_DN4189_c0_g1_i1.p1 TRINITY_DN4189_c0_g1~~TRINITY_DN4189_c0_g1_i1.p1  ORF type:complete len:454 (-),score=83.05 TRINITY_DN4189_c0_g1_i1:113-1474(-)
MEFDIYGANKSWGPFVNRHSPPEELVKLLLDVASGTSPQHITHTLLIGEGLFMFERDHTHTINVTSADFENAMKNTTLANQLCPTMYERLLRWSKEGASCVIFMQGRAMTRILTKVVSESGRWDIIDQLRKRFTIPKQVLIFAGPTPQRQTDLLRDIHHVCTMFANVSERLVARLLNAASRWTPQHSDFPFFTAYGTDGDSSTCVQLFAAPTVGQVERSLQWVVQNTACRDLYAAFVGSSIEDGSLQLRRDDDPLLVDNDIPTSTCLYSFYSGAQLRTLMLGNPHPNFTFINAATNALQFFAKLADKDITDVQAELQARLGACGIILQQRQQQNKESHETTSGVSWQHAVTQMFSQGQPPLLCEQKSTTTTTTTSAPTITTTTIAPPMTIQYWPLTIEKTPSTSKQPTADEVRWPAFDFLPDVHGTRKLITRIHTKGSGIDTSVIVLDEPALT